MNKYEIMFIVRPDLEEANIKSVVSSMKEVVEAKGAKVLEEKEMGQRELAYEIKDFKNGYYYVITLEASDDKAINEFDRLALISGDMIRHLITKLED